MEPLCQHTCFSKWEAFLSHREQSQPSCYERTTDSAYVVQDVQRTWVSFCRADLSVAFAIRFISSASFRQSSTRTRTGVDLAYDKAKRPLRLESKMTPVSPALPQSSSLLVCHEGACCLDPKWAQRHNRGPSCQIAGHLARSLPVPRASCCHRPSRNLKSHRPHLRMFGCLHRWPPDANGVVSFAR